MVTDGPPAQFQDPRGARASFYRLYGSPTMLVLLALGFSGGLPNVLITGVSQAWTSAAGWGVAAIGALAFCTLPYALKFLWAPLVDSVTLPLIGRLGRRRSWLLLTQLLALVALVALCLWAPVSDAPAAGTIWSQEQYAAAALHNQIFILLLALAAFFSATQDIVGDAFRAEVLTAAERGAGASAFITGYRIAFVVLGAGVLVVADRVGWTVATLVASLGMAVGICATLCAREPLRSAHRPRLADSVVEPLAIFWRGWGARSLLLAAFVLLFKLPDQLATSITTPLLMKGLGYSAESIGWIRQAFGFAMTIAGAAAGGWMVARWGVMRCLFIFGVAHCVSIAGFLALTLAYGASVHAVASAPPPAWALIPAIGIENLVIGMVTSGFVAFLMGICDHRYTATQYALLTALMAAGNALAGGLSGTIADRLDYPQFLIFAMIAGIPGVLLIPFIGPPNEEQSADTMATP